MDVYDDSESTSNNLSRVQATSAKVQRYKVLLARRWWFLLLCVVISVCGMVIYQKTKPDEFKTVGRIVAGTRINVSQNSGGAVENTLPQDFYGTQIETLESPNLRRRALERVQSLYPDTKEVEVELDVFQTRGSSILRVVATGEEKNFTRFFLDAILDEYMALRKEMVDKSIGSTMNKVIEEVLSKEKAAKQAKLTWDNFLKMNDIVIFEGNRNQAAAYLTQIKANVNLYETEKKLMDRMGLDDYLKQKDRQAGAPGAGEGGAAPTESKDLPTLGSKEAMSSDLFGGLSRAELEYLKAQGELQLKEAERLQLLRFYRPQHPNVTEMDEDIEKQKALVEIHRKQSMNEWERRGEAIKLKIENLNDEIKIWEVRARDANEKIVTNESLKDEYENAQLDHKHWLRTLENLDTTGVVTSDLVSIMDRPSEALKDEGRPLLNYTLAVFGGLLVGTVILFLFDRMDDRMNSYSEFQTIFPNESIIGQIPDQKIGRGDVALVQPSDSRHLYAEAFRNLRSSIIFKNWKDGIPPKLIMVTSAVPNEGKTTSVSNMAITMALGGSRVLLVDGDLRRGGVRELFGFPEGPGLSEALMGQISWQDAVVEHEGTALHVLPRGMALSQCSELYLAKSTEDVLQEMAQEYDYVVFDSAPVLVADDTASFAPKMDAVFFVVRLSSTMARLSAKALELLHARQVNVAGVILNRANAALKEYTYYNYASYYSVDPSKAKARHA